MCTLNHNHNSVHVLVESLGFVACIVLPSSRASVPRGYVPRSSAARCRRLMLAIASVATS